MNFLTEAGSATVSQATQLVTDAITQVDFSQLTTIFGLIVAATLGVSITIMISRKGVSWLKGGVARM